MLNAPIKEGEALANKCDTDGPVEIFLHEDKEQPMAQVLRTLYGSDPSTKTYPMSKVKEIAILAEKYGMIERLEIFASFWLIPAVKVRMTEVSENAWNALVVAYILKINWAFFSISMAMLKTRNSLLKFAASFYDKHTGLRLGSKSEICFPCIYGYDTDNTYFSGY
jgi:hypothetical protein